MVVTNDEIQQSVCYADHDSEVRALLAQICDAQHWKFVSISATGLEAIECEVCDPGCVVVDLDDDGIHWDRIVDYFHSVDILVPVVVLAADAKLSGAVRAMRCGAHSVLSKPCTAEQLEREVTSALEAEQQQRPLRNAYREARAALAQLTNKERDVLLLAMEGTPNKAIAQTLEIGVRTVEKRRADLLAKLGVTSIVEAARKVVIVELQPIGLKKPPSGPDETAVE